MLKIEVMAIDSSREIPGTKIAYLSREILGRHILMFFIQTSNLADSGICEPVCWVPLNVFAECFTYLNCVCELVEKWVFLSYFCRKNRRYWLRVDSLTAKSHKF